MGTRFTWDLPTTAVVCVECQNGTLGADVALPVLRDSSPGLVQRIGRVVGAARPKNVRVFHATYEGALGATEFGSAPLWRHLGPGTEDWGPGTTSTQVVPELLDPSDIVTPRHHGLSPVHGTELISLLKAFGIRTIVLTGVSLNVALPLTVGTAIHEGFRVVVVRDAVGATPPEYGELVLENTMRQLARLLSTDELLAEWDVTA